MFTMKTIMEQLGDHKLIMERMRKILQKLDPGFVVLEEGFRNGVQALKDTMDAAGQTSVDRFLELEDGRMANNFLFLTSKGYNQNLACFKDPMQRGFLNLDFEDIHDESIMESMQANTDCWKFSDTFFRSLTPEQQLLCEPIRDYYIYMETTAYKLAHYLGFRVGDEVLPLVVPGYRPNTALTHAYRHRIDQQLGVSLEKLEG